MGYILTKEVFASCYGCKESAVVALPSHSSTFNITVVRIFDLEKQQLLEQTQLFFCPNSDEHNYQVTCNSCSQDLITERGLYGTLNKADKAGIGIDMHSKEGKWVKLPKDMVLGQLTFWDHERSSRYIDLVTKMQTSQGNLRDQIKMQDYVKKWTKAKLFKVKDMYKYASENPNIISDADADVVVESVTHSLKNISLKKQQTGRLDTKTFNLVINAIDCPAWIKKKCEGSTYPKPRHYLQFTVFGKILNCKYCKKILRLG